MLSARRLLLVATALVASGCAAATGGLPAPDPSEIPDLEAWVDVAPGDEDAAVLLAAAYRGVGRHEDALRVVQDAGAATPGPGPLTVMEGVLHEDLGDDAAAMAAYRAYLDGAQEGALREEVEGRVRALRRRRLQEDVREALARERELADIAPDPAAVGVFPFVYEDGDPIYAPLGKALAELLITDLGVTGRLRVLERVAVQALVDELALSASGLVDPATGARGGRVLGAGHVVQGRYRVGSEGRLGLDAAVVRVAPDAGGVVPVPEEDAIERLLDLEKRLALSLHDELGIRLTPAERARVDERQTRSVQALLAFGRGLDAEDRGDFQEAERSFARAAELDPGFRLAVARRGRVTASRAGTERLSGGASRLARRRQAVLALRRSPAALRHQVLRNLTQRQRAALAEVLGQDRLGSTVLLELVFTPPGGGP